MGTVLYYAVLFAAAFGSIVLHEVAHGYAAYVLGDDTAKRYGRLSLNPLRHVDPFGTIALPLILIWAGAPFLFGWAKPVPVNFARLKNPRRDLVIVSAAGIIMNFGLLLLGYFLLTIAPWPKEIFRVLVYFMVINFVLILFNILPIPPLDGSKMFFGWIKRPWAQKYIRAERQGLAFLIIVALILPPLGNVAGEDWDFLRWYFSHGLEFFATWAGVI